MAITKAVKDAIQLRGLFKEHSVDHGVIVVYCDSQSAICFTKDQMYHERTKHIVVQYHFILEILVDGYINVLKIGTENNHIDMLTKLLPIAKFEHYLDLVSICCK